MTEGTQNIAKPAKKPSLLLIAGGTLGAIAIAVFASQFLRPEEAQATGETSGKATVSGNARTNAVARVDSKYITYEEVAKEAFARIGSEVLDSMINRLIIQREVEKRGIVITEADVHQEVVKISKRFNLPTDTWYQMLQTERNLSPEQYRRDVIWPMIALRKLAGESIDVSPEDMQEAFVRDYGPRVRCRMILMDNFRRANDVWQQASAADLTNFEKLARDNSIDPSSRALGGSIPPISRHSGNKALEDAAFRLKAGEVSGLKSGLLSGLFDDSGQWVVTTSEDQTAKLWNRKTGELVITLAGHTAAITSATFSPDSRRLVTASRDSDAKIWDISFLTPMANQQADVVKELLTIKGHKREITSVEFSPDGRHLATSSRDGRAILWKASNWNPPAEVVSRGE